MNASILRISKSATAFSFQSSINFNKIIPIIFGWIFILTNGLSSFAQVVNNSNDDDIIKISTELVSVNYQHPKDSTALTRIFDGKQEITNFKLIRPSEENKLQLVVILDFGPCGSKSECRNLSKLGENLRKNFNLLRNNEKPLFIANTESLELDDVKKLITYNAQAKEVGSLDEALFQAQKLSFEEKHQRQALLIITNKLRDLRDLNLTDRFANYSGYVELITTKAKPDKSWIGWNNLGLPGSMLQDNGDSGFVFDIQLSEFVETCNLLNAVSFYREDESSKEVTIKTYSKIWGEQTRSRVYLTPQLAQKKLAEKFYDDDIVKIGSGLKTNQTIETNWLLPVIQNNLNDNPILKQKIRNAQAWLKTKYGWTNEFPSVTFNFEKDYVGIQEFKVIAYSTKALENLSEEELATVTAHELAHIILKSETESEALEEKCDFIAYLILPQNLRPSIFTALQKMSPGNDKNHLANRNHRLKENLSTFIAKTGEQEFK